MWLNCLNLKLLFESIMAYLLTTNEVLVSRSGEGIDRYTIESIMLIEMYNFTNSYMV